MVEKLVNSASVLTSRIYKVSYLPWRLKFGHLGASGYQIYFSVYRVGTNAWDIVNFSPVTKNLNPFKSLRANSCSGSVRPAAWVTPDMPTHQNLATGP